MNILRLIAIIIVIWLLFRLVKNYRDRSRIAASRRSDNTLGTMIECAHCGLHVPEQEAVRKGKRFYCSKQHADKGY